jgi:Tol biopolymer transport system component
MSTVLVEEPARLGEIGSRFNPALEHIVRRCLEKSADDRFQNARDLAFALESNAEVTNPRLVRPSAPHRAQGKRVPAALVLAVATALAGLGAGWFLARHLAPATVTQAASAPVIALPSFQQLTYRRGVVTNARFAPGGPTVIYDAMWEGGAPEVFSLVAGGAESTPLGGPGEEVLSVSTHGDVALQTNAATTGGFDSVGTLALQPLGGGAPRPLADGVHYADVTPSGTIAVVTKMGGKYRLEYPMGTVLYETAGWISHPRVSPDGTQVAFLDHPIPIDDRGSVEMVDKTGHVTTLSSGWDTVRGLAWSAHGNEVWFTAGGGVRALYAVSLTGQVRNLLQVPGSLLLQDVAPDGRVLMTRDEARLEMMGQPPGETSERNLTWFDWTLPTDLSTDGKTVLFCEEGNAGGSNYTAFARGTDGSPAVRLGEGQTEGLSPDGQQALAITFNPEGLYLLPTGAGDKQQLPTGALAGLDHAFFLPDGKHVIFNANEPGRAGRAFEEDLPGSTPQPLTPEGVTIDAYRPVSPDGRFVFVSVADGGHALYPLAGGALVPVTGIDPDEWVSGFTADGKALYVGPNSGTPVPVSLVDVATGTRTLWRKIGPSDPAGVEAVRQLRVSADGKAYVYSYHRSLSDLYLVTGVE